MTLPAADTFDVKWSYEERWGNTHAVCTVTYRGRTEQWLRRGLYVTDDERYDVPKKLLDKLKATIRLFGPVLEDYPDDD